MLAAVGEESMSDSLRQHDLHQVRRVSPDGDLSGWPRPCQNVRKMNRARLPVKAGPWDSSGLPIINEERSSRPRFSQRPKKTPPGTFPNKA